MPKAKIITGLDIGSGTIKLLTAFKRREGEEIEVLSKVQEASFGVRRGVVIDPNKLAEIINSLITKAEEDCGQKIKEVNASVGGSHIFSQPLTVWFRYPGQTKKFLRKILAEFCRQPKLFLSFK
jgi:cell division protein FtsA